MKTTKQTWIAVAWIFVQALTLLSCTQEKGERNSSKEIEVGGKELSIVIREQQFDNDMGTRAVSAPSDTSRIDLGNGLEAEISIEQGGEENTATATATRVPLTDGHYNIYVYNDAGQMLTGAGKSLSGTFTNGKFIRDKGKHLCLAPGKYKFVCTTDGISLNNRYGIGSTLNAVVYTKEMVGVTEEEIVTGDEEITFMLYHRVSRVRVRFTAYTNQFNNVKASFSFPSSGNHHHYMKIPTGFSGPPTAISNWRSEQYTLPATPNKVSGTYVLANEFITEWKYINNDNFVSNIFLNLSGNIYGKSIHLQDKQVPFANSVQWKDNGSYTINIKLKPNVLYVFQDGTCGAITEKGSRTAIGAVVQEKTNQHVGKAIALKDAGDLLTLSERGNKKKFKEDEYHDALEDMNGFYYTWDKESSIDDLVKAEHTEYRHFYAAAHYNPGIKLTGKTFSKWYLPSLGEWRIALKELVKIDLATKPIRDIVSLNKSTLDNVFTQAGVNGDALQDYKYLCSTQDDNSGLFYYIFFRTDYHGASINCESFNNHLCRSFIHF